MNNRMREQHSCLSSPSLAYLPTVTGKRPNGVVYRFDTKNSVLGQENTFWNQLHEGEKRSVTSEEDGIGRMKRQTNL